MAPHPPREVCDRLREFQLLGDAVFTAELHKSDIIFQAAQYDIVIVDCGSNDLANGFNAIEIANNLLLFGRRCIQHGAKIVFLTSIIPRRRRINCSEEQFFYRAEAFNKQLKQMCVPEKQISFHRHSGFATNGDCKTKQPVFMWSEDDIHPSGRRRHPQQKSGMEKYHQSIKTALHRALHRHRFLQSG